MCAAIASEAALPSLLAIASWMALCSSMFNARGVWRAKGAPNIVLGEVRLEEGSTHLFEPSVLARVEDGAVKPVVAARDLCVEARFFLSDLPCLEDLLRRTDEEPGPVRAPPSESVAFAHANSHANPSSRARIAHTSSTSVLPGTRIVAPLFGVSSTRFCAWSFRSASRTGVRLTPNRAQISSWYKRDPADTYLPGSPSPAGRRPHRRGSW